MGNDQEWDPDKDFCPTFFGVFVSLLLSIVFFWVPIVWLIIRAVTRG